MVRFATSSLVLTGLSAILATVVGCAQEPEDAGALEGSVSAVDGEGEAIPDEDLAALGVEADEEVVDEVSDETELANAAAGDDEWGDQDELPIANDAVGFDPEDGMAHDDLEDFADEGPMDVDPDGLVEPMSDSALALGSLGAEVKRPAWWGREWACPKNEAKCECHGSPFNCQFPNKQVGRNRYLPARAVEVLNHTTGKKTRAAYVDLLGRWAVDQGTEIYDGNHILRGRMQASTNAPTKAPIEQGQPTACYSAKPKGSGYEIVKANVDYPCTKINFGLKKTMKHEGKDATFVYAFATAGKMPGSGKSYAMSGWILRSSLKAASIAKMGDSTMRKATAGFVKTQYVIKSAKDYGCAEGAGFDSTKCLPAFSQLKIRPKSSPKVSEKMRDYMLRDGGFLNLAFQTPLLGGAAADTVIVRPNALGFRRVKSTKDAPTVIKISLYHAKDKTHAGTKVLGKRAFFYGELGGSFGWVAAAAIKPGKIAASSASESCEGKATGYYCATDPGEYFYCNSRGFKVLGICAATTKCIPGADGKAAMSGEKVKCE